MACTFSKSNTSKTHFFGSRQLPTPFHQQEQNKISAFHPSQIIFSGLDLME